MSITPVLKVMWQHVRPHKAAAFVIALGSIGAAGLDMLAPWFYKRFFDVITAAGAIGDPQTVASAIRVVVFTFLIHLSAWTCYRIVGFTMASWQPKIMTELEQTAFHHVLGHSFSFFANTFTGGLVRKVRRLSRAFEDLIDQLAFNFLQMATVIIGTLISLYLRNATIALAMLAWIIIIVAIHIWIAIWKLKYDEHKAELDSEVTSILADAVTNSNNVKLFVGQKHEESLLSSALHKLRSMMTFRWRISEGIELVQTFLMILIEFVVMYLGVKLWMRGELSIGDFALFQGIFVMLFGRIWNLGRSIRHTYEAVADAKEMVDILEIPHEIVDAHGAKPLVVKNGEIVFEDVGFAYRKTRQILHGLNLTIRPHEKVAFVGPSGAGKTTAIKLLLRLHEVSEGKIRIDGKDIAHVTQDSLHKNIALVPQDPILFHRSIMENIRYGKRDATDAEVMEAARKAHCHEFITDLPNGYETFVGERGIKLSGGERQRVAIARAILANTPILVLDEATSSLDSQSEALIQGALKELMKDKTAVVIAHRLSTIQQMDRIVVIDGGQVVDEGTHKQLIRKRGIYKRLWEIQAGGFIT